MKVMISQPMRGRTEEEIKKERELVVKQLESEGHEVVDTIFNLEVPKGYDKAIYYLSKSIEVISQVDAVVFMPGWNLTRGCAIEKSVAELYGKYIKYVEVQ